MRPVSNTFSIVIVGAWNPSIFTPDWVSANLTDNATSEVLIAFSINDPTAPRKISFEGIDLFPGRQLLNMVSTTPDKVGIKKCSEVLIKILELLGHTPILSAGVNFSFFESRPSEKISTALLPSDTNSILEEYTIKETKIDRTFAKEDDEYVLNFALLQNANGCTLSYNFHYENADLNKCIQLFSTDTVTDHLDTAIDFSVNYYEIELEADDTEE